MPLRITTSTVLTLVAIASSANAALVAQFRQDGIPFGSTGPVAAFDYADHVTASDFAGEGGIQRRTSAFRFYGWSPDFDNLKYAGFKVSVEAGHSMTLTDLAFSTSVSAGTIDGFRWGYRVDNGSGFGAWVFGETYDVGDTGFATDPLAPAQTWDFADFTTSGTVEFGLFAKGPNADSANSLWATFSNAPLTLNGTVVPVPEPSALLIAALGGLGLLRRRR